jgi:DNA-binding SARP family transcriptional activator
VIAKLAGVVELFDSESAIAYPISGDACRIAFAVLAFAHPHATVPDQLAHAVWGDEPPLSWPSSLRNIVSRLRKQLPSLDTVESTPNGYRLALPILSVDVVLSRRILSDPTSDPTVRRAAIATLQSPFVPGATSAWIEQQARELTELMLTGLDQLAANLRGSGDHRGALTASGEAVALAPLRESSRQELFQSYLSSGAHADGLRAYEHWRRTVGEELGAVPSPESDRLYLQLLGIDPLPTGDSGEHSNAGNENGLNRNTYANVDLTSASSSPDQTNHTGAASNNAAYVKSQSDVTTIPSQFSAPLVGRAAEVEELRAAIEQQPVVLVSGLGGVGKSHLVANVVAALLAPESDQAQPEAHRHEHPRAHQHQHPEAHPQTLPSSRRQVFWISMDSLERSQDPLALLADRLEANSEGQRTAKASISLALAEGSPIVVLDGATMRGAASLVKFLSEACPKLTTVVTSRQPLESLNGSVVRIGPLRLLASAPLHALPSTDSNDPDTTKHPPTLSAEASDAAQFLWSEATRLGADPEVWTVAECELIANQLDGIALGLSLAAKRAPVMSPQAIRASLELQGPAALDEQQHLGLAAVVGWTIAELTPHAREVFDVLSLLAEAVEFDAAIQICAQSSIQHGTNRSPSRSQNSEHSAQADAFVGSETTNASEFASALTELLNVGLLKRTTAFGRTRFSVLQMAAMVHDSVRESASASASASANLRIRVLDAHARYFQKAAAGIAQSIRSSEEADAVRLADLETPNFTGAIDRFLQLGRVDEALQTSVDLVGFAFYRLNQTLASAIVRAVSSAGASSSAVFPEACAGAALMAWMLGDAAKSQTFLAWSKAPLTSWVYRQAAAVIALYSGDVGASGEHFQVSLSLAEANESLYERTISLSQITLVRTFEGRADALDSAIESFRCGEASKNPTARANGAWAMGIALLDIDPEGAREHLLACRSLALEVNARLSAGSADAPLAMLEHRFGATADERRETIQRQMKFWLESSHSAQFWLVAQEAAVLLCEHRQYRPAALILGAVSAAPFKVPLPGTERRNVQRTTELLAVELGERYPTIHQMGTALSANSCAELIEKELLNQFA